MAERRIASRGEAPDDHLNWEPDPGIDESSGEPYQFRSMPFSLRQLNVSQWCRVVFEPYAFDRRGLKVQLA